MIRLVRLAAFAALACAPLPLRGQYEGGGDVPYVPTPQSVVDAMLKLGQVKAGDVLFDLGCGDGRIVITAARDFGATGTGIDINPKRIEEAVANAKLAKVEDKVRFLEKNLFEANFSQASVVTLYLLPDVNLRLRPILLKQLRNGTRIVSHSFDMGDWKAEKEVDASGRTLYLWTVTDEARKAYGDAPSPVPMD